MVTDERAPGIARGPPLAASEWSYGRRKLRASGSAISNLVYQSPIRASADSAGGIVGLHFPLPGGTGAGLEKKRGKKSRRCSKAAAGEPGNSQVAGSLGRYYRRGEKWRESARWFAWAYAFRAMYPSHAIWPCR